MTIIAYIILIILTISSIILGVYNITDDDTNIRQKIGGCILIFSSGILITIICDFIFPKPSAIDVYRNKTTLEITETVRDSVVIDRDSVVVWKKEIK